MIKSVRKILVIVFLFCTILAIQQFKIITNNSLLGMNLISIGFLILAAYSVGEILKSFSLPPIIGYFMAGLVFGGHAYNIRNLEYLSLLNPGNINNFYLLEKAALALVALSVGLRLNFKDSSKSIWGAGLITLNSMFLSFIIIIPLFFLLVKLFLPEVFDQFTLVLSAALLLALITFGNSIEAVQSITEPKSEGVDKNKAVDILCSVTVLKDFVIIILALIVLPIVSFFIIPEGGVDRNLSYGLLYNFLGTLLSGLIAGTIIGFYNRFIKKEQLLFTFAVLIFGAEISNQFNFNVILSFIIAGLIIKKFSDFNSEYTPSLDKMLTAVFILIFVFLGAKMNIFAEPIILIIALILFIAKVLISFIAVRLIPASLIGIDVKRNLWMGFLTSGNISYGLLLIVPLLLLQTNLEIVNIFTLYIAISLILGSLFVGKLQKTMIAEKEPEVVIESLEDIAAIKKIKSSLKKEEINFTEPDFEDTQFNRSLYQILFKMRNILQEFEKKFIYKRGEESLELVLNITEIYTDEYNKLRELLIKSDPSSQEILNRLSATKKNIINSFYSICEERKKTEKDILNLETLITDLYFSLGDLTDGLKKEYSIPFEQQWFVINPSDSMRVKVWKYYYRWKKSISQLFNKKFSLKRKIEYQNLAKYYLLGESANEILESVNLVGTERLTTLRKISSLFKDLSQHFDEFEQIALGEKGNIAIFAILLAKLDEIHHQVVNEINIYTNEINNTSDEIRDRLYYALAVPYNNLIETLKIAGTYKFNKKKYRYSKVFTSSEATKDITLESIRFWVNYYIGFLGKFQKEILTAKLKVELYEAVNNSLFAISDEINFSLRNISTKLTSSTRSFVREISKIEGASPEAIISFLSSAKEKYYTVFLSSNIRNLEAIYKGKKLNLLIENLLQSFAAISNSLPEKIPLLEESDLKLKNRIPSFKELRELPIRKISNLFIVKKLPKEIGEVNEILINHLNMMLQEIKNISSIVNFYFNTAIKELELHDNLSVPLSIDIIRTFTEKIASRSEQLNEQIERLEKYLSDKLIEKLDSSIGEIQKLSMKSTPEDVNKYFSGDDKKEKISHSIKSWKRKILLSLKEAIKVMSDTYRESIIPSLRDLLFRLGIRKQSEERGSDVFNFSEEKLQSLPFIYRKLFDGAPLESVDFFIGRKEFESKFSRILKSFAVSEWCSTFIVGETGSGKRSLVNNLVNFTLKDKEVKYIHFHTTITDSDEILSIIAENLGNKYKCTLDELILQLNDKSRKEVFILEGINKLYLRAVNGYEALNTMLTLISLTSRNTLWICTINKHAFNFLNSMLNVQNYFKYKIVTEEIHRRDIRTIIMTRHNATGFTVKYQPDNFQILKKKFLKVEDPVAEQTYLANYFFKKLEDFCEGNIIAAMYYWLQSIESVKDNRIMIKPPSRVVLNELNNLPMIYLLTLAGIMIHGSLTDDEHADIFNISAEESNKILNHLSNLRLINEDNIEAFANRFFINKFIFKVVEKELTGKKIL